MIQKPYAPAAIPQSGQYPTTNQGFPQSNLLGAFISKLPYAYQIIDSMVRKNPKYEIFRDVTSRRDDLINDESIFVSQPNDPNLGDSTSAGIIINKDYQAFVYASVDKDKTNRLMDYRRMASYAEMADCMDEIADECIVKDENDNIVTFQLRGDYSQEIKDTVEKEFKKFINIYDLEDTGWEYFRQFLTDGELFFENIIDEDNPDLGIVGIVSIPSELINPVYQNTQNELIKGYLLIKPLIQPLTSINKKDKEEILFLQKSQVTYVHTGIWNEFKTIRLPYIENAKRAYRQLSLIEDSIVIYRLVRAPERLVFKVFTGNMPAPKAEAYLKRLMQQYWSRKNYDTTSGGSGPQGGRVTNVYDPQSMLDSYWFPKDAQGNGTDVTTLQGGSNLGEMKDLEYFLKKLYKAMKVPASRFIMDSGGSAKFTDGTEITREELRFARYIIRIQRQFATSIRDSFIVHLKLRKIWKECKLRERAVNVEFNVPTSFMAMREQELLKLKFDNFSTSTQNQSMAPSYAQKYYLGLTDEQMTENREWLRKDAALEWELTQIKASGPNFREQIAAAAGGAVEGEGAPAGGGGGGGGEMPSGGEIGGAEMPPEFGNAEAEAPPEAGEAETPTEAPAGGTEAPTEQTPPPEA